MLSGRVPRESATRVASLTEVSHPVLYHRVVNAHNNQRRVE